ncbi:MAG: universal stress protein [Bacteroidia bacterium]|nr:universal stress protein [Bacteroidia bacterium]MDW8158812.1 universal stress protein [Bacteroidia bacterium]
MVTIKTIVHPTDFSEASLNAYRFAAEIARATSSDLILAHVYEKPYYSAISETSASFTLIVDTQEDAKIRQAIREQMVKMTQMDFATGVRIYEKLITDIPAWKFYEDNTVQKADLIVMGTRGATSIYHGGIVGTNAERVIRHSPIPVLSVPVGANFTGIKQILLATDFQDPLDNLVPWVITFCQLFGAELYVGIINTLNNFSTTKFAQENYAALKNKYPLPENTQLIVYNEKSVEDGIMHMCLDYGIDLIAMLTHGRTGFSHFLKGSIAEDIAAHLRVAPLLTVKNSSAA